MIRCASTVCAAVAFLLVVVNASAVAAPAPFGHACTAQNGVRFCPSADLNSRVPSFDGVPIDVDVTLPATGDGSWPVIVMAHGLGGSKDDFESTSPEGTSASTYHYNNVYFASRGYAVVNYSARGFGNSCGVSASRTAGCERGWVHIDDTRFEARDVQTMLGTLADEGIADPTDIGVTGISYGGGTTNQLAFLKDRIRLNDGSFASWKSPSGTPMAIRAAFPRWGWADLAAALMPNGRYLDTDVLTATQTSNPVGVMKMSYTTGLYLVALMAGYVAPPNADPQANITSWIARMFGGEPYNDAMSNQLKSEIKYHGIVGIPGAPAAMLIEDGWNDDLFTAQQALLTYNQALAADPNADVSLQLGDTGHPRGANKPDLVRDLNDRGSAFFDAELRGVGSGPAARSAALYKQTCPKNLPTEAPIVAPTWAATHPGTLSYSRATLLPQVIGSAGLNYFGQLDDDPLGVTIGNALVGLVTSAVNGALDPSSSLSSLPGTGALASLVSSATNSCATSLAIPSPNSAIFDGAKRTRPFTLAGMPKLAIKLLSVGQNGELAGRLWDVDNQGRQTLVSRGEYRLTPNQSGTATFQLHGNAYTFAAGHYPRVEVMAEDGPYLRPGNGLFSAAITGATISLPTAEATP